MNRIIKSALLSMAILLAFGSALAATAPFPPTDLDVRVGWDQRLGAQVPANLRLRDAQGKSVTLSELSRGKPMLLSMGYYRCPNLCGMVLHGLGEAATKLSIQPGIDYQVAFVSIDPNETAADATAAKQRLARMHPQAHIDRWHLLTGDEESIRMLAGAVGFRYFYDPRNQQYAHAAGAAVLTGGDKVAQYFFGVAFAPRALRLALVDASRGKLGSMIDQLVLLCCGYDPSTGRYSLLIGRIMQILGIGFALVFGAWLLRVRRKVRSAT